jgi:aspartate aminotransferase
MMVLCDSGDEVLIPAPYWVTYPDQALLAGATPVFLPTGDAQNFKITREQLSAAITSRSRVLIINSPSNPTGMAYSEQELRAVVGLAIDKGLVVVSDEMYEKTIYDGFKHVSPASFGPEFKERVITVNGLSKTYAMTGWRLGYAAGPEEVIKAATNIQDQVTSGPNSITQKAAVEALRGDQSPVAQMVAEFDKRRKYIVDRLNKMRDISCVMPQGAFYVFPNVSKWYGRKLGGKIVADSFQFCDFLLERARIAAVPGAPFGAEANIRFSYATALEKITEGMNRMEEALKSA